MTATTVCASRATSRVLVLEDHAVFAESIELALQLEGYDANRLPLPADHRGAPALLSSVARLRPRVVLLDLDLGSFGDGATLIHPMACAGANVVVVTAATDRPRWGECMRQGARKVLTKTQSLNEILGVVRRIHEGLPVVSAAEREALLRCWEEHRLDVEDQRRRLSRLTRREQEVLTQLQLGHSVREIARESVVSEATVRTQVKAILAKLEVPSQLAAVGLANAAGWRLPAA